MNKGDYVSNERAPQYGFGKVVSNDGQYLTVYFESLGEEKDFSVSDNPLKKENISQNRKTEKIPDSSRINTFSESGSSEFRKRVERDTNNASLASLAAKETLRSRGGSFEIVDFTIGRTDATVMRQKGAKDEEMSLRVVMEHPFHAMMEVITETIDKGKNYRKEQLIYANEHTNSNLPGLGDKKINILAWTHPIVQLSISGDLNEENDIRKKGYTLQSVTPVARARYSEVQPYISGIYEPGGSIRPEASKKVKSGLKAVKLNMTKNQVDAFLSKMSGMMLVTGAPGSGKTTVAMQRIRFLCDQQDELIEDKISVRYSPDLTRIFLANRNLVEYSKAMLENELHIPSNVVEVVESFISRYLGGVWTYKHNAKLRRRKLFIYEEKGRQAFWGLCTPKDLKDCWLIFESQIADRLKQAEGSKWFSLSSSKESKIIIEKLASSLVSASLKLTASSPQTSAFNMDVIYQAVKSVYEGLRIVLMEENHVENFDQEFQQWLFWVYDPYDALVSYFYDMLHQGGIRIRNGVGLKIRENEVLGAIKDDWQNRIYGKEEEPWLAFLLRFSLPAEPDYKLRFREVPNPVSISEVTGGESWTHIMIDEAQDLCVAEAALLSSFVHPDGAFTVSADFHQVVSPVWGMSDPEAFKIGCSLKDKGLFQSFPFAKNLRQTKQIGLFLRSFYQNIFNETAYFTENDLVEGSKPLLIVGRSSSFAEVIKQRINVLRKNQDILSIALLQVDEDEEALSQYRNKLLELGVTLAPIWQSRAEPNELITTSVERIKGLEYDACFVIGMDSVENSTLKHSKNRAYVAVSRPALQLTILCEEIPRSLRKIDNDLVDIFHR